MIQSKVILEPILSPSFHNIQMKTSPSINFLSSHPTRHQMPQRNPSLPVVYSSFKTPIPANVINIIPKSRRKSTLRIFKAKMQEEKDHVQKELEQPKIKKSPYSMEIKRKDTKSAVEALVEKSKQDYHKKKKNHLAGSMYINDLWGKRYEVTIRKQAKIDVELQLEEDKKRRPLKLKLEEASDYFEQIFHPKGESIKNRLLSPNNLKNFSLLQEIGHFCETDISQKSARSLLTERGIITRVQSEDQAPKKMPKIIPRIQETDKEFKTLKKTKGGQGIGMSFDTLKPRQSKELIKPYEGVRLTETENSLLEHKYTLYFHEEKPSHSPIGLANRNLGQNPGPKGFSPKRNSIFEKKKTLNNILNRCQFEVDETSGWMNELEDYKSLFRQNDKKKKQKYASEKREEIIGLCKSSLEKKVSQHKRGI